jgi:hypothetical protein
MTIQPNVNETFKIDNEVDWDSIYPPGDGYVFLGPQWDQRKFGIEMFHSVSDPSSFVGYLLGSIIFLDQLHCLDSVRKALLLEVKDAHAMHCLNYVRQALLCHADPTLMPYAEHGIGEGITHKCRDWNVRPPCLPFMG